MIPWTVVVGVDGSSQARDAAVLGRRLVRETGGILHLVTAATDPLGSTMATSGVDVAAIQDAVRDVAWRNASEGLEETFSREDLELRLHARLGRSESVLADFAREAEADLVVLGGHKRGTIQNWMHHSTTRHLLRVSDTPVLVTGPAGPEIDRVLVALDLSGLASRTVEFGEQCADVLGASLEIVHVVEKREFADSREVMLALDSLRKAEEAAAEERLRPLVPERARWNLIEGHPAKLLEELAGSVPSTLLVLGAQGRGWVDRLLIGSTSGALINALPSSLAILPAPRAAETEGTPARRWRDRRPAGVG